MARNVDRAAVFQKEFREDLRHWVKTDRNTALRVFDLVEAILRDPFRVSESLSRCDTCLKVAGPDGSRRSTVLYIASQMTGSTSSRRAITTNRCNPEVGPKFRIGPDKSTDLYRFARSQGKTRNTAFDRA